MKNRKQGIILIIPRITWRIINKRNNVLGGGYNSFSVQRLVILTPPINPLPPLCCLSVWRTIRRLILLFLWVPKSLCPTLLTNSFGFFSFNSLLPLFHIPNSLKRLFRTVIVNHTVSEISSQNLCLCKKITVPNLRLLLLVLTDSIFWNCVHCLRFQSSLF